MTVEDDELIEMVAKLWVSAGGDAEGFEWLKEEIKRRIRDIEECEVHG